MTPQEYIGFESTRQSANTSERLGMFRAFHLLESYSAVGGNITEPIIKTLAHMINGSVDYRRTPVTFNDGGYALPASQVSWSMKTLIKHLSEEALPMKTSDADYWVKEFLIIHPFTDGNGRIGSLLWNFLRNTLDNPEPMPYYFGEGPQTN